MVEANKNPVLHTHYLPGTLPGGAPGPSPTVHIRKPVFSPRAIEEDPLLVQGDTPGILPPQVLQRSALAIQ